MKMQYIPGTWSNELNDSLGWKQEYSICTDNRELYSLKSFAD